MSVRVRFAPSPTGYLHVGGARTALFNWLFARHHGGVFVLRIEDTDQARYQADALEEIFTSLTWLNLDWDEGPDKGGNYGPYTQSQRLKLYLDHAQDLLDRGLAYRCFCTPERLANLREQQQKAKMQQGSGYDRHCRNLSQEEVEAAIREGKPAVVRLKIPDNRHIVFKDLIRGDIEYDSNLLDDIVLLKSDGFPTYHLANVIDDHHMGITHILRGDEWIASTPRHVLLYEAFGWQPPQFAHMPVILSPGGGKLSKRKGAASVMDYQNGGFLPEALFNFLALLGWAPGDDREIMAREEMVAAFSLAKVSAKASVFDEQKLEWMNGQYIRQKSSEALLPEVEEEWRRLGYLTGSSPVEESFKLRVVDLLKERSKRIKDLAESARYFFQDPQEYEEKAARKQFKPETATRMKALIEGLGRLDPFTRETLEDLYRTMAEDMEISAGKLIHPTRLAVSGVSFGPGLFELLETLGKEKVLRRMKRAVAWISNLHGPGETT